MIKNAILKIAVGCKTGIVQIFYMLTPDGIKPGVGAFFITTDIQFYILGALVGLVMGGIQSVSRSTYANLMPETRDTASFFSFFDVTEKIALVIGMFSFGFINELTGSQRSSVLALMVYFIIGLILLFYASAVKNTAPQNETVLD